MATFCFIIMASSIMSLSRLSQCVSPENHTQLPNSERILTHFLNFPPPPHFNSQISLTSTEVFLLDATQRLKWGAQTHSSSTYLSLSEICFLQFFILSRLWTLSDGDRNLEIMIRCLELISVSGASSSFTTSDIITRKWQRRHRRPGIKVKWGGKPYRQVPSIFSLNQIKSYGHFSTHWHLIVYCFYFPSWLGTQPEPSCVLGKCPTPELHSLLTSSVLWCIITLSLS